MSFFGQHRLYEAARWNGLREDNPAADANAPRERTSGDEQVKYLPLEGLRRLLAAPAGDCPKALRDRAILVSQGVHGLRVAEVAGLESEDVDPSAGTVKVLGKGRKTGMVYL